MFHHLVCDALFFFLRLKTILLFVSFENEQGCCTRIHNGELVIRATVMDQIYKYALSQHPNSERLRLQNHWASSSSDIISLFDKGHNWIGVDAVALMLTELGIEFEFADWQTLKLSLTQIHQTGSDDDGFADTSDFGSHARSPRQLESQPSQSQSQAQSQDAQAGVDSSDGINIDIDDDQERETGEQAQEERIKILEEKVAYLQKLSRRNALITHLQSSKRIIQQRVRRLHKDMGNMKDQHKQGLIKIKHGENSAFHIERKSDKPKSWLTPQGTVAVALRRNIGNVSCALLGHVVLQDLAGCTVSRCEVKTAAALVAHSQMFYEQLQHSFQIADFPDQCLAIHAFREDATNSGIWRKSKLSTIEIESFFTTNMSSVDVAIKNGHTIRRLGDVQRVADSSGMGTATLCWKQMQSIGCPTWYEMFLVTSSVFFSSGVGGRHQNASTAKTLSAKTIMQKKQL